MKENTKQILRDTLRQMKRDQTRLWTPVGVGAGRLILYGLKAYKKIVSLYATGGRGGGEKES